MFSLPCVKVSVRIALLFRKVNSKSYNENNMYIPIILGTAREGRISEKAALFVKGEIELAGHKTEIIDVREYAPQRTQQVTEKTTEYGEKIKKAEALIIVSPEYNHGYPGELKMLLDAAYAEYAGKPLGICGVSISPMGGCRMVEQVRLVSVELHMVPIREAVYFSGAATLFNDNGVIKDEAYKARVKKMLEELVSRVK